MAAATSTTYDALLRELWPQEDIYDELYTGNAFFAMVPKDTTFYEKIRHVAVGYGTTQGVGQDFTSAKKNKSGSKSFEFKITPVSYYSLFSIQRQLLRRAGNKKAAILPALERESRMAIQAWKRDMAYLIWGTGVGDIGKIATAGISGATITLDTQADVRHFEINMSCQLSVDNTGSAGVKAGTAIKVVSVSPGSGSTASTVTFDQNITTAIPTAAAADYIYREGNYNACVAGVQGWLPSSVTATAWFGLDRTAYSTRMAGVRTSATGLSPRQAAMKAAMDLFVVGGKPTHYFLSPDDFLNLQVELQSAGTLQFIKEPGAPIGKYTFGTPFEGISMMGPSGPIKVFADINCPAAMGLMTQLDTWTFASMGDAPYFDMEDGNRILREGDSDSYEGRIVGDFQLYNEAPLYSNRVTL